MITIQPANTATGEYDVRLPLPYPFHIEQDGSVGRQDFWKGRPARLMGFQKTVDSQIISLWNDEFHEEPQKAVGMFAVFIAKGGEMFNLTNPISSIRVGE